MDSACLELLALLVLLAVLALQVFLLEFPVQPFQLDSALLAHHVQSLATCHGLDLPLASVDLVSAAWH
jgi:hypothetical protein